MKSRHMIAGVVAEAQVTGKTQPGKLRLRLRDLSEFRAGELKIPLDLNVIRVFSGQRLEMPQCIAVTLLLEQAGDEVLLMGRAVVPPSFQPL